MVPNITLIVVLTSKRAKDSSNDRGLKFCPENTELTVSTARSPGLYDDLSEKEIISEGFYTQPNVSDVYVIELQQPSKDEAIKFLDNNGP